MRLVAEAVGLPLDLGHRDRRGGGDAGEAHHRG